MIQQNIYIEHIDLVFKNSFINFSKDANLSGIKEIMFKNIFWENTFLNWINILLVEFKEALPKVILNKKSFSLSFEIVDNLQISNLNQEWLKKSGPTDVLSFPIISKYDLKNNLNFIELGDIFLSLEIAIKQSIEYNVTIEYEVLWLASHGFLHLLGWDHQDQNQLENMLKIQEYLISKSNLDYLN